MADMEAQARAAGYGWGAIDDYLAEARANAAAEGYSSNDVDFYLGFDPHAVAQRAQGMWGDKPLDLGAADWRGQYANALANGETRGVYDWADSAAAAGANRADLPSAVEVADRMAAGLPSRRAFIDGALGLAPDPDSEDYARAHENLVRNWQDTGEHPAAAVRRATLDPDAQAALLAPRPQRTWYGEIAAGIARGGADLIGGLANIGEEAWRGLAKLSGNEAAQQWVEQHGAVWAKREAEWHQQFQRGEGLGAFIEGTVGEAVPTIAEYMVAGVPAMMTYGALHGASAAWERTGSVAAAATGAAIGAGEAGIPGHILTGAAGQGLIQAAVKGAVGFGALGGVEALVDPLVDTAAGRGYQLPTAEEIAERAAAGAITGVLGAPFFAALKPRVRVIDPDVIDFVTAQRAGEIAERLPPAGVNARIVELTDRLMVPTPELHDRAVEIARTAGPILISSKNVPGELPIVRFRQDAKAIEASLPEPPEGMTRLWRGNRPGEIGSATSFTSDLPGIALPFREPYGGHISYVDVPTKDLAGFESKAGAAPGVEFSLPTELASTAKEVAVRTTTETPEQADQQALPLAEGYRAAFGLRDVFDKWLGPLWRDETGAMPLGPGASTPPVTGQRGAAMLAPRRSSRALSTSTDRVEQIIRRGEGMENLQRMAPQDWLKPLWQAFEPHVAEWKDALAGTDADRIMGSKIGQMIAFLDGEPGSDLPADHPLRPAALTIRNANLWSRAWMENSIAQGNMQHMNFVKEYWARLWKDPVNAERIFGSVLSERSLPSFREGIQAGLRPLFEHPIDNAMHNLTRAAHIWNRQNVIGQLAREGHIQFTREQPSGEMTKIEGVTRRQSFPESQTDPNSGKTYERTVQRDVPAYASPAVARMVENWYGALRDYPIAGSSMEKTIDRLQHASNTLTALKLALPLFHAGTMILEDTAGALGNAMREIAWGEPGRGLEDIVKSLIPGVKAAEHWALATSTIKHRMLPAAKATPDNLKPDPLVEMFLTSGGRHGSRQAIYRPGTAPSIVESLLRGTLGREMREELQQYGAPGFAAHELGRIATTISAPLFDHIIPLLKTGVNLEAMQTFLRTHPGAGEAEVWRHARQIIDNTDHRMGELNMNNIFWPRIVKRLLALTTISTGWWYGTLAYVEAAFGRRTGGRGFGGGSWEWNPYAAVNLASFIAVVAGANAIYQFIKTGTLPGGTDQRTGEVPPWLLDLASPRTGGLSPGWTPARTMLPGQQKEFYDWGRIVNDAYAAFAVPEGGVGAGATALAGGLGRYLLGKQRPVWQAVEGLVRGKDALGRDIAHMPGGVGGYLLDQVLPIFAEQAENTRPAAHLGYPEIAFGMREMPAWIEDRTRFWRQQRAQSQRVTRDELRRWRRWQQQLQPE